jgi:RNA polymerase sigma-70 factor (ECF subfamily)
VSVTCLPRPDVGAQLETHRARLRAYCYRMLGSAFDAEDAVQETLVRAWRGIDRFEGKVPLEAWLYRIATNVCFDHLRGRQRRALPVDVGPASSPSAPLGAALPESTWVGPLPDAWLDGSDDPADRAVSRETIRLAFVAALQHLTPRQRAVLILRDVLRWRAHEVATLLGTSVVSVKSVLQRARAALADQDLTTEPPDGDSDRELLDSYLDAFERYDVEALVSLLHEDATLSMPPLPLWLAGAADIEQWWRARARECQGSILVPTAANGSAAVAQYRRSGLGDHHEPFALLVFETGAGRIRGLHAFLDPGLFRLFDLPERL